jgi:hypothetical protein
MRRPAPFRAGPRWTPREASRRRRMGCAMIFRFDLEISPTWVQIVDRETSQIVCGLSVSQLKRYAVGETFRQVLMELLDQATKHSQP